MDQNAIRRLLDERHGHVAALLDALGPDRAAELAAAARLGRWSRGERVTAEDGGGPEVAFVIDGALGMSRRMPGGPDHIVGLLVAGDMFGRLGEEPPAYGIEALSDATALLVRQPVFEATVEGSLEAERLLLVAVLDELDAAREWLILMGAHGAAERLAGFLMHLLKRRATDVRGAWGDGRLRLDLPMRRVDLARHLGVRPESLSRAFRRLEREGILRAETSTTVAIDDPAALVALSGQDGAEVGTKRDRRAEGRERRR